MPWSQEFLTPKVGAFPEIGPGYFQIGTATLGLTHHFYLEQGQ
jgi:hypothetical protein